MNWYLQSGKESDVVISSRVRLARNLKDINFTNKCLKKDAINILKKLEDVSNLIEYGLKFIKLKDIDDITKLSLVEKHIISPEFALNKLNFGGMFINDEENICIMVNEEDHLRLQVFSAGLEIEEVKNLIVEIDEHIGKLVNYAYSKKYGFLTPCPTNIGTGMKCSVMVHLPALTLTGNINKILKVISDLGMNIRGVYGEGTEAQGNIYQISNKQSLGITENEIVKNLKIITEKIIEQERLARNYLAKNSLELEDMVYRAYGVLMNCKKISSEECRNLLSQVKLGVDLGIIKELTDLKVNKLEIYTKSANLQKELKQNLEAYERDIERAKLIKQIVLK